MEFYQELSQQSFFFMTEFQAFFIFISVSEPVLSLSLVNGDNVINGKKAFVRRGQFCLRWGFRN